MTTYEIIRFIQTLREVYYAFQNDEEDDNFDQALINFGLDPAKYHRDHTPHPF